VGKIATEKIAIIGLGRVGLALALLLGRNPGRQLQVYDRNPERIEELCGRLSGELPARVVVTADAPAAMRGVGLVFLAVQDRFLAPLAAELAAAEVAPDGVRIAHLSGSLTAAAALGPLAGRGAVIFSLHPLQSLADVEGAVKGLAGSWFTFEGDERGLAAAREIVADLGGRLVPLKAEDKPLYHAAAVVASNFFIALEDFAIRLMSGIGVDEESARQMLLPLIRGSFENLERQAPLAALTGPIVRGDDATIAAHLEALGEKFPEEVETYRQLARLNLELARRRGEVDYADFPSLGAVGPGAVGSGAVGGEKA
jgi:predicted short-subunit dehydrogenase-like oxidoreductase (DUF2520 family)